jgi:hypothetical protein
MMAITFQIFFRRRAAVDARIRMNIRAVMHAYNERWSLEKAAVILFIYFYFSAVHARGPRGNGRWKGGRCCRRPPLQSWYIIITIIIINNNKIN